jgi:hypothetical protein
MGIVGTAARLLQEVCTRSDGDLGWQRRDEMIAWLPKTHA